MKKIGITGTIAAGKTSFCILLKRKGFPVFNSDQYAKLCLYGTHPACAKIVEAFGDVLDANGDVDRKKLAGIVFQDEEKRKQLNAIVHPYVIEGMKKFFDGKRDMPFAFAEVPLLFEAGMEGLFDEIVVVTCSEEVAIQRMMEDRSYSQEEAYARYHSQIAIEEQMARADVVIENDETLKELDSKVNRYVGSLRRKVRQNAEA